jgi:hypothetical protein
VAAVNTLQSLRIAASSFTKHKKYVIMCSKIIHKNNNINICHKNVQHAVTMVTILFEQ